jgi:hypothetical protein
MYPLSKLKFETTTLHFSLRWVQGYRYLDRCGEALCRIEKSLDDGWIVGEATPKAGTIKNFKLGMVAQFNSEYMSLTQREFISIDHFVNESSSLTAILASTFGIEGARIPTVRITIQHGCDTNEEVDDIARQMELATPRKDLLDVMQGNLKAANLVFITGDRRQWEGASILQRRRIEVRGIRQERQPDFDSRIVQRGVLLGLREREAMKVLRRLRETHTGVKPAALEVETEQSFEEPEFPTGRFPTHRFLFDAFGWSENVRTYLQSFESK